MSKSNIEQIKKLRDETGVSVALVSKALNEATDYDKAKALLSEWGIEIAEKKSSAEASDGVVESYVHHNKRMGAMVIVHCQTDFVAKNEDFRRLAYDIAMQIASMEPKTVDELIKQPYIKDSTKTIDDLLKESIVKLGENIRIGDFVRFSI